MQSQEISLFRINALKHLNASETIDEPYIKLVEPGAWIWVLSCLLLISSLIIWIFAGKISMNVAASGIILPENSQVSSILALIPGKISAVYVKPGDHVKTSDLLAEVADPKLSMDINYLTTLYNNNEKTLADFADQYALQQKNINEQFQQETFLLNENLKNAEEKVVTFKDLYDKKLALFKKHYLTIPELAKGKEDYVSAKDELAKIRLAINEAPIKFKQAQNELKEKMNQQLSRYLTSKHELDTKLLEKKSGSKIISSTDGMIMSSSVVKGDFVTNGKTLFTLINPYSEQNLNVIVFINHQEGKKINVGMEALVSPSNLSSYQYGYMKGKIIRISEYPASKESVFAYLGNMNLVDEFFNFGPPFVATIQLERNSQTRSGFSWTTRQGPPFAVQPGTLSSVKIIYKKCSPFSLLTHKSDQ